MTVLSELAQAKRIFDKEQFAVEAHLHALANLKKRPVMVIQDSGHPQKMDVILYNTDFTANAITRPQTKQYAALKLVPYVPIYLNYPPDHYQALVAPKKSAKQLALPGNSRNAITLDLDD